MKCLAFLFAVLFAAPAMGCARDPVRPDDGLRVQPPPAQPPQPPPPPPVVVDTTTPIGLAEFTRTTSVGSDTFANGYLLASNRNLVLWRQVSEYWTDEWEFAIGNFTLTDTVIVLRLTLVAPLSLSQAGVYEVNGILRGDTLRVAYPDSMQAMSSMFAKGEYLLFRSRGFP